MQPESAGTFAHVIFLVQATRIDNEFLIVAKDRVSIKDIADAAGVTHPTVSRALNNSTLISEPTRTRIQRIAREMGYTPDAVAQSLQTRRTHIIGLVVASIGDPFFADLVKGVEEVARPAGFSVFLNSSRNDPEQEIQVIETFHRQRVDGILVASSRIGTEHVERLARINVPVVLVNSQAEGEHDFLHSIAVDDRVGARRAVEHLIELGHRRIAYIGVTNRPKSNKRRLRGYQDALEAAGIESDPEWIRIVDLDPALEDSDALAGKQAADQLCGSDVTAVFCYNDMVAVGALLACREADVAVPQEVSIIGFDDIDLARYVHPALTSVAQPKRQMGSIAMQMVVDLLGKKPVANQIIEPIVMKRQSTSSPETER